MQNYKQFCKYKNLSNNFSEIKVISSKHRHLQALANLLLTLARL